MRINTLLKIFLYVCACSGVACGGSSNDSPAAGNPEFLLKNTLAPMADQKIDTDPKSYWTTMDRGRFLGEDNYDKPGIDQARAPHGPLDLFRIPPGLSATYNAYTDKQKDAQGKIVFFFEPSTANNVSAYLAAHPETHSGYTYEQIEDQLTDRLMEIFENGLNPSRLREDEITKNSGIKPKSWNIRKTGDGKRLLTFTFPDPLNTMPNYAGDKQPMTEITFEISREAVREFLANKLMIGIRPGIKVLPCPLYDFRTKKMTYCMPANMFDLCYETKVLDQALAGAFIITSIMNAFPDPEKLFEKTMASSLNSIKNRTTFSYNALNPGVAAEYYILKILRFLYPPAGEPKHFVSSSETHYGTSSNEYRLTGFREHESHWHEIMYFCVWACDTIQYFGDESKRFSFKTLGCLNDSPHNPVAYITKFVSALGISVINGVNREVDIYKILWDALVNFKWARYHTAYTGEQVNRRALLMFRETVRLFDPKYHHPNIANAAFLTEHHPELHLTTTPLLRPEQIQDTIKRLMKTSVKYVYKNSIEALDSAGDSLFTSGGDAHDFLVTPEILKSLLSEHPDITKPYISVILRLANPDAPKESAAGISA